MGPKAAVKTRYNAPWLFSTAFLGLTLLMPAVVRADAPSIKDMVKKADMILRGATSAGVFSMEVKTASYSRSFQFVMWDDGRGSGRTTVKILGPALWRGYGTLKIGSQLKIYNPRTNHITVVGESMLGDSWMGSHFSYDDLVKETRLAQDYTNKLLKTWKATDETGKPATFFLIELSPNPTAPVAWGKILLEVWERGDAVMPVKTQYFRKPDSGKPERVLTFSDIKEMGGRLIPATMVMTVTGKPGEYTSITCKDIRFDVQIPDSKFTEQSLRQ
jgi:Outer membrane lipoprotein-sorting protein